MRSVGKRGREKSGMEWFGGGVLILVLAVVLLRVTGVIACTPAGDGGTGETGEAGGRHTVGSGIVKEDVTEFYYTVATSTFPPHYQRYRFYTEDGGYRFFHETREGERFPLTEADATVTGTVELTKEQWDRFFELIDGGKVSKRQESADAGDDGPWLYLYWTGDDGKYQEYEFPSYAAQKAFAAYCEELAK